MRRVLAAVLAMVIPLAVAAGFVFVLFRFAAPQPVQPTPSAALGMPVTVTAPGATLAPTATPLPTVTPAPTATPPPSPTPHPTSSPTAAPSDTPIPTQTPRPTATATPTEIPPTPDLGVYGEVVPFALNLRSGPPGTEFQILYPLRGGDRLQIIGQARNGTWLQVAAPNGTEGWVSSEHVAVPDGALDGVPVIESAG